MDEFEGPDSTDPGREATGGRGALPRDAAPSQPPAPAAVVPAGADHRRPQVPADAAAAPWLDIRVSPARTAEPAAPTAGSARAVLAAVQTLQDPAAPIAEHRETAPPSPSPSPIDRVPPTLRADPPDRTIPPDAQARPVAAREPARTVAAGEPASSGSAVEMSAPPADRGARWATLWRWTRRLAIGSAIALGAWVALVATQIVLYRAMDPPFSNLMLMQRASGAIVVQKWIPIEQVPAQLIRAIVVSEDGRFCSHRGIDFKEIEAAIERSRDGTPRGASTITMQVAKNLFLWPSKSYVRKAIEVPITLAIEALWTKRRIFEVYVNIAEWGPGVFGAEAAAGYHFGKSATRLNEREAALLAVSLPNPVERDAGDPGPGTERLANTIQARMRAMSRAATCVERRPKG